MLGTLDCTKREADISEWVTEYSDTLTKEPGMTDLTDFFIDTGDSMPIAQRPYNIPLSLRDSVDKELDWLLAKGYISEPSSQLAAPMVTVKKPDWSVRICVDFKNINSVTTPLPFYAQCRGSLRSSRQSKGNIQVRFMQGLLPGAHGSSRCPENIFCLTQGQI